MTASTPQRVHLEPDAAPDTESDPDPLQPHNGFIWNSDDFDSVSDTEIGFNPTTGSCGTMPGSGTYSLLAPTQHLVFPSTPNHHQTPGGVDGTPPSLTTERPPTFSHDGETDVFKSAAEPTGRYEPRDDPRVSGV